MPKKTHCKRGHLRSPENVNRHGDCIQCRDDRMNSWRKNNPDYERKWCEENPERRRAISLASHTGIDKEAVYQYLLERENTSVCDICQQECSTGNNLSLDHDHETNEIRGLLCKKCNSGLGMFNDSVKLMELATEYLKNKGIK